MTNEEYSPNLQKIFEILYVYFNGDVYTQYTPNKQWWSQACLLVYILNTSVNDNKEETEPYHNGMQLVETQEVKIVADGRQQS